MNHVPQCLVDENGWCALRYIKENWRTRRKLYSPSRHTEIVDARRRSFLSSYHEAIVAADIWAVDDVCFVPSPRDPLVAIELFGCAKGGNATRTPQLLAQELGAHARYAGDGTLILWGWLLGWTVNRTFKDGPLCRFARLTAKGQAVPLGVWCEWSNPDIAPFAIGHALARLEPQHEPAVVQ